MSRFSSSLDQVRIAAPCSADWDQMVGTDRVRFCGKCSLNVYNLSELSRSEAENFIANNEGRVCVRFYRRADGSILTKNCPVGLRAIRRRRVVQAASASIISFLAGLGVYAYVSRTSYPTRPLMGEMVVAPHVDPSADKQPLPSESGGAEMVLGRMELVPRHHHRSRSALK